MNNKIYYTASVVFCLFIGFLPVFGFEYISLYFKNINSNENYIHKLELEKNCNTSMSICNKKYIFSWIKDIKPGDSIIIGRAWNAVNISCDGSSIFSMGNPTSPSGSRDTNNVFHILDYIQLKPCKKNITVDTYFPYNQKKFGLLDNYSYIISKNNADSLKRFNEFILQDFKILNLCSILAILLFSIFIRIVAIDSHSKIRVQFSYMMAALALAQSGLLEVWFPFSFMPELNRWFAAISCCLFFSFGVIYLNKINASTKKFLLVSAVIFVVAYIITQSRLSAWISFAFIFTFVYIYYGIKKKSGLSLTAGLLVFLAYLEYNGVKWVPNSYTVPTFFALLIISENQKAFLSYLKINRLLKMSRLRGADVIARKENSNRVHSIVKIFQKQFNAKKITVLNLSDIEVIRIMQYDSDSALPNIFEVNELPPIFAHVISTGNALINVHEDSNLVTSFRRGEYNHDFKARHFTVLPLFSGKETIGAIALTEYDHHQFESSLNYATFIFCLDILRGLLVEHLLTSPKTESLNKIKKFFEFINSTPLIGKITVESEMIFFADAMTSIFGWRVASGRIDNVDRLWQVNKINNFDERVKDQVLKGKIYAHKDNRQGPFALAVHEIKPVIVPNTKWLEGVVHENTIKFFNIHATKTAAFVPVIRENSDNTKSVIGVYWIEGVRGSEITYSDRELFNSMMKTISDRLQRIDSAEEISRSRSSLAQFVPQHLVDAVMRGEVAAEKDHGYLLMFDLKGSTRLAHKISNDSFRTVVADLKDQMKNALLQSNWVLQQYEWDAFYFTKTADASNQLDINSVHNILDLIFENWKSGIILEYGESTELESLSYRICFTYGDTSRGIVQEGATQAWTFTGNAIAVVSKVENESKKLNGQIFADDSILSVSTLVEWVKLQVTPHGFSVYGIVEAADDEMAA